MKINNITTPECSLKGYFGTVIRNFSFLHKKMFSKIIFYYITYRTQCVVIRYYIQLCNSDPDAIRLTRAKFSREIS